MKYKAQVGGPRATRAARSRRPLLPELRRYTSALAPLVTRTMPVSLPPDLAPSHQTRTMCITRRRATSTPSSRRAARWTGGEFGKASLEVTRDPKRPVARSSSEASSFDLHLIPVEKYPAWRAFLQQIDALMHKEVRLVPAAGGEK